jgi:DNA-binding transcriptional LysR family regulator
MRGPDHYEDYVASLVADGRLVSLLDKSVLPVTDGFFLFYPSRRQNPAALRALIEFLRSDFRACAKSAKIATKAESTATRSLKRALVQPY